MESRDDPSESFRILKVTILLEIEHGYPFCAL